MTFDQQPPELSNAQEIEQQRARLAREIAGLVKAREAAAPPEAVRSQIDASRSFARVEVKMTRARGAARARRFVFAVAGCALVAVAGGFWASARLGDVQGAPMTYALDSGGPARGVGNIPAPAAPAPPATKP